jgi:hypothetical protein
MGLLDTLLNGTIMPAYCITYYACLLGISLRFAIGMQLYVQFGNMHANHHRDAARDRQYVPHWIEMDLVNVVVPYVLGVLNGQRIYMPNY